ncbi:IMP cyclohydrolase [Streptomyces sp. NPDC048172]|uniref:IMP cyclohydrolase n=1 Tax=Streptomyces sp. NPDC048172 TaxID=3365505 RepID=UPI003721B961
MGQLDRVREVVAGNAYPGRGVLWGRTLDGTLCAGYFLTGRSPASKARAVRHGDAELIVSPTGASRHDPLRHYVAARERDGWLVFGNGEQVATVSDRLRDGRRPVEALGGLEYEPDPPIFTPRITVVADLRAGREAWFGAARRSRGGRTAADVLTLAVRDLEPGDAVLMTTYRSDGRTVATGEPFLEARTEAHDRDALLEELWGALSPELRVAVAVFEPGRRLADATIRHEAPVSGPDPDAAAAPGARTSPSR